MCPWQQLLKHAKAVEAEQRQVRWNVLAVLEITIVTLHLITACPDPNLHQENKMKVVGIYLISKYYSNKKAEKIKLKLPETRKQIEEEYDIVYSSGSPSGSFVTAFSKPTITVWPGRDPCQTQTSINVMYLLWFLFVSTSYCAGCQLVVSSSM